MCKSLQRKGAGYLVPQRVKNSPLLEVLPHATYTQVKVVLRGHLVQQIVKNSSLLRVLPYATYTQVKVVLRDVWSSRESRILLSLEFCHTPPTLR